MAKKKEKTIVREITYKSLDAIKGPAQESNLMTLLKSEGEEIKKSMTISLNAYFYDMYDEYDIEHAVATLEKLISEEIPVVAKMIRDKAIKLGVSDKLMNGGSAQTLLAKSEEQSITKEANMADKEVKEAPSPEASQIEELTKQLADANSKIEELTKPKEEIYKSTDGKEYSGEMAVLAKRLDDEKADRELERRATELKHMPGDLEYRKDILKAADGMPEKTRETFLKSLEEKDAQMATLFKSHGAKVGESSGDPLQVEITKNVEAGMSRTEAHRKAIKDNPDLAKQAFMDSGDDFSAALAHMGRA